MYNHLVLFGNCKELHKPRQRKAAREPDPTPSVSNLRPKRNPRVYPLSMPMPDGREKKERRPRVKET